MMKDIENIWTAKNQASSSMPEVIKLVQYVNSYLKNFNTTASSTNFSDKQDYGAHGSMGNGYFAYAVECNNCDTDNFAILKNICTNMRDPTISKDWIFNNFYVFEIPDYGNQSMSKTFVDFVPQCFYDPEHLDAPTTCVKIKSSYIGMIRSYTQKTAYVLIDKSKYTAYPLSTIIIRCVFKNNLENNYSITTTTKNDNNTFSLTITPDSAVYFQNESDFQLYANKNNGTSIPLDTSLCFIKYSINEW